MNNDLLRFRRVFSNTVIVLAVFVLPTNLKAAPPWDTCQEPQSRTIIDSIMNRDFKDARNILQNWQNETPTSAEALFYSATIDMAEAKTQRKAGFKRFNAMALKKLKQAEKQLRATKNRNAEQTLTLGMTEAFMARLGMENEEWRDAYNVGRRARDRLRSLLKTSADIEDANLVLGLYEFYTGDIPITLKWLTFLIDLSGNRKKGIALLERSIEQAPTASPEAARTLIDELELDAPEICQWLPLNAYMQKRYPNNPRFAWRLQRHYRECGFPEKALRVNKQATHQFASFSSTRMHLLADRARIYRDVGDTASLESLSSITPKLKNLDKLLKQASYVKGNTSGIKYTPPVKINNPRQLIPHNSCNNRG